MIKTAILVVWIGVGQSQSISVTKFDTISECRAARAVLLHNYDRMSARLHPDYVNCFEVEFSE